MQVTDETPALYELADPEPVMAGTCDAACPAPAAVAVTIARSPVAELMFCGYHYRLYYWELQAALISNRHFRTLWWLQ